MSATDCGHPNHGRGDHDCTPFVRPLAPMPEDTAPLCLSREARRELDARLDDIARARAVAWANARNCWVIQ